MVEERSKRGSFLLRRGREITQNSVCGNAAVVECWDTGDRSLVSCNFL